MKTCFGQVQGFSSVLNHFDNKVIDNLIYSLQLPEELPGESSFALLVQFLQGRIIICYYLAGGTSQHPCFGCSPLLWAPYSITHQHKKEFYDCLPCHLGFALAFCIALLELSKPEFGSVTILWTQSQNPRGISGSLCSGGHPTRCLKLPWAATNSKPQK